MPQRQELRHQQSSSLGLSGSTISNGSSRRDENWEARRQQLMARAGGAIAGYQQQPQQLEVLQQPGRQTAMFM